MPDSTGKLTAEEYQRFQNWIQIHWGNRPCEMCGTSNWNIGNIVTAEVPLADGMNFLTSGTHYPSLHVLCMTCANTKNVNAIVARIIIPNGGR